jgi:hypothetical protein
VGLRGDDSSGDERDGDEGTLHCTHTPLMD